MDAQVPAYPSAATPPPPSPPPPLPARHRARRWLAALAALLLLVLLAAGAGGWWALRSENGTAWLLSRLPGVEVVNPQGRLIGDFSAETLTWRFGEGGELRLSGVAWDGLGLYRSEVPGAWALLWFDRLAARQAHLTLPDRPQTNQRPPPEHLKLPLELVVREFALDELQASALGDVPLQALRARIHLGGRDSGGGPLRHRIDNLNVTRGPLQASGRLRVEAEAPMPADIALTLAQPATPASAETAPADAAAAPAALPAWEAQLSLTGPLARSQLRGRLQVAAPSGQAAPSLDADAVLQPFAAWPLAQLNARTQALDIGALVAGAPRTALSGDVVLRMADAEKPLQASARLANAHPGAWNAGLLPARQLQLVLQADPRQRNQARLERFEAELGDATQPAGRITGDGLWRADGGWQLGLALRGVRPDRLDARALPMQLEGRVNVEGNAPPPGAAGPAQQRVTMTSDVSGQLLGGHAGPPLQLKLAGTLDRGDGGALSLALQHLLARQGDARAEASGRLQRASAQADWAAQGKLALNGFDPGPWLPGDAASPWRRAPSRLNGQADVDLRWSAAPTAATSAAGAATRAPAAGASQASAPSPTHTASSTTPRNATPLPFLPPGLQGRVDLAMAPSTLAGVPLQGSARLRSERGNEPLQLALQAEAAGNKVTAEGRLAADAARDHWSARVDAPALNRLTPLLQALLPAPRGRGRSAAGAGSLQASAVADGRWPRLQTQGTLRADGVVFPGGQLRQADARWNLGTAPGAALSLDATLAGLRLDASDTARQVPSLSLKVSGTAERHQLALQSEIAAAPPAWADALQNPGAATAKSAPAAGPRTRIALAASGALRHGADGDPLSIAGWRGRIDTLALQRAESTQALLRTAAVPIEWQAGTSTQPTRVVVQPGRAELLGSSLRWSRLAWAAGTAQRPMQLEADATLDPLRITPLLARLQPSLSWAGDLAISGRAVVRTAPTLQADITLQRHAGDLSMMQGELRRGLGLTELKASLQARGTRWRTEVRMAGREAGALQASVTATTNAQNPWPGTDTPIDGSVQLRIDDIGLQDARLPVGWHLAGRVSAEARLGGRIGAPTWRGSVRGSGLGVNNFVEGVRVHSGELQATLDGDGGRIERFVAKAGDGQLRAQGDLRFGADPRARINVSAERFRALGRVDRLLDLSGQATLDLQRQQVAVQGRFQVDQGLVDLGRGEAPELSKDVRVIDGPTPGRPETTAHGGQGGTGGKRPPARPVQLDLRVDLGQQLRVRGKGVNTLLAGDLRLTAPGGQLDVEGTVRTVGGTYEAYGEKLRIDRGLVTFVGPVANPRLDIQAVRADLRDVEVGVAIGGTAQNPRVTLFSSPEMSELDKLSWLTLGRSSAGLASDQSAILQRAALALLAGQRGSAGGEGIAKRLGLDKISVGRGQSGGLSDAVVSLGKQISERFYVGYAQSLDATGGSWELVYKVARRLTVRVQAGEETALDVVWSWVWG